MFTLGTNLAVGTWDAINTLLKSDQETIGSGFFPTAQRDKIVSETTQAAGGTGQTYRPTSTDAPSIFETVSMALKGWLGSPYQEQYSVPAKVQESKQLAGLVESKSSEPIGGGLDWALDQTKKVVTLWDQVREIWDKPREVIQEKPRAGYPEGQNLQHTSDNVARGAQTIEQLLTLGKQFYGQVKGLFGLGYESTESQPVAKLEHEISLPGGVNIGIIVILIILFLIVTRK